MTILPRVLKRSGGSFRWRWRPGLAASAAVAGPTPEHVGAMRSALELALGLLDGARHLVAGTYLMPSFGRYEQAAELVRRIRALQPAG